MHVKSQCPGFWNFSATIRMRKIKIKTNTAPKNSAEIWYLKFLFINGDCLQNFKHFLSRRTKALFPWLSDHILAFRFRSLRFLLLSNVNQRLYVRKIFNIKKFESNCHFFNVYFYRYYRKLRNSRRAYTVW